MARESYLSIARKKIRDIVYFRSQGYSGYEVAARLGLVPWEVYALTQFIKVCVSTEEKQYLEEEAEKHKFGTIGEFIMDVFNRCYEKYYEDSMKKNKSKRCG